MSNDVAMQSRCIYCKREQYAMRVWSISQGKAGCAWCGKTPPKMTQVEWVKALEDENYE